MKTKISVIALVLIAAAGVAVKIWFFPSVKDNYFAMDGRGLRAVPAGMLVVRPTHFAFLKEKGILRGPPPRGIKNDVWLMGRNAPLRDVMGAAYGWGGTRVVMPPDAPTGHFDFLMTGTSNQMTSFQTLIRHKLGYIANVESQSAEVVALRVANPALPSVAISPAEEKRRINLDGNKLRFQHVPMDILVGVFGRFVEAPMLDKTGLTNFYDFAIEWNSKTDQSYSDGTLTRDKVDQIITPLGLKLEPDKAPLDMLVVKKAE